MKFFIGLVLILVAVALITRWGVTVAQSAILG